jgi:uncharacterized protein with PIN domain
MAVYMQSALMSNSYERQKFLCDPTVGRLCRYMRMIGYDTAMAESHEAKEVLSTALDQGRTILTRNSVLAGMKLARDIVLLTEDDPWQQLRVVIEECGLMVDESHVLTRCLEDNEPLREIARKEVKGKVWPYVYQTQGRFIRCPSCGRIYWPATHVEAMMKKLRAEGLL